MTRSTRLALLGMTLSTACFGAHAYAAETMQTDLHETMPPAADGMYEFTLDEVIVTGYRTATPLTLSTDPQRPRQPIPPPMVQATSRPSPASPSSARAGSAATR